MKFSNKISVFRKRKDKTLIARTDPIRTGLYGKDIRPISVKRELEWRKNILKNNFVDFISKNIYF
ncbi:TPA_asm: hypothetical protein [Altiarchaeum virus]|nr:MAG: hypothetical protein BWK75_01215 [Candidatus Altiarchaeales archaeon A3]DAZ85511.1 TPA_asm: hypothetical protein [Altiarchaeum virus]